MTHVPQPALGIIGAVERLVAKIRWLRETLKEPIRRFLYKRGYEVRPLGSGLASLVGFLQSRNVDTVLDVGANVGQFALSLRSRGYMGKIVSFEPLRAEYECLTKVASTDHLWRTYNCGLSNIAGSAIINVSERSVFSSLHAPNQAALSFDSRTRIISRKEITIARLDELIEYIDGDRLFLKIDVQGHEKTVMEGAIGILHKVVGVQLELPFVRLYQFTWRLSEALDYMESLGFEPSQIAPVSFQTDDPVSFVEIDVVFRRIRPIRADA
jgi:FkbM family methyltransferase